MAEDPYRYFRLEAREILDQFDATVLALQRRTEFDQIPALLRLAHTLKGAARIVKQPEIAEGAHAIEEVLSPFRESTNPVPESSIGHVLKHLDAIAGRMHLLERPPVTEREPFDTERPPAQEDERDAAIRTVRVDIAEMDGLLDGLAEAHARLNGLRTTAGSLGHVRSLAQRLSADGPAAQATSAALTEELHRATSGIERRMDTAIAQIDRELRQLRGEAEQLRLASVDTLLTQLERTAHDTARALSKEVVFAAHGVDVRLDADMLGAVQGALVQILRNAVAHGIEPPAIRRSAGKTAAGQVTVDIKRLGGRIVFACTDDGRGINLEAIRNAARRRGISVEQASRLDAHQLIDLLLRGGISTSDAVTEVAGRGIGLDVVRAVCERLGGSVTARSEPGSGTTFELTVPLSLTAMDALIVEAAGTAAAVPFDAIRGALLLRADALSRSAAGATVIYEQRAIPFLWLPHTIGGHRLTSAPTWPTIIVAAAGGTAAVGVDRLLATARIVARPLPKLAPAAAIIAGASLDTDGNPLLVFDPDGLVREAQRQNSLEPEPELKRQPVLIVDDSLTTRMLEQSILESAGYEVDMAASAEEGLEIARQRHYALFLVDVEMPGIDGFTFVERARADPALHDIPAVLVTSRAAPEDRRRGRDAGARGYIVKGDFNQAELLTLIESLVG